MGLFSKSFSSSVTESDVLNALRSVQDPDLHRDVVSLGMIQDVTVKGSKVSFTFELTTPSCPIRDQLEREAREAVERVAGVGNVEMKMTARVPQAPHKASGEILQGVKNTIAIASGKGGVGKSTVAANLAVQLARDGARVGLLDADIYGPSIPLMFGLQNAKPAARQVSADKVM